MANYGAESGAGVDHELHANLRNDAMNIRLYVSFALTEHACNQINERARENVARASTIRREMVHRMVEPIQANGEIPAPDHA